MLGEMHTAKVASANQELLGGGASPAAAL
jgi:hypothetical protein